jgi:hypothetical protein
LGQNMHASGIRARWASSSWRRARGASLASSSREGSLGPCAPDQQGGDFLSDQGQAAVSPHVGGPEILNQQFLKPAGIIIHGSRAIDGGRWSTSTPVPAFGDQAFSRHVHEIDVNIWANPRWRFRGSRPPTGRPACRAEIRGAFRAEMNDGVGRLLDELVGGQPVMRRGQQGVVENAQTSPLHLAP